MRPLCIGHCTKSCFDSNGLVGFGASRINVVKGLQLLNTILLRVNCVFLYN